MQPYMRLFKVSWIYRKIALTYGLVTSAGHRDRRFGRNSRSPLIVLLFIIALGMPVTSFAQCGGDGQRACCNGEPAAHAFRRRACRTQCVRTLSRRPRKTANRSDSQNDGDRTESSTIGNAAAFTGLCANSAQQSGWIGYGSQIRSRSARARKRGEYIQCSSRRNGAKIHASAAG